MLLRVIPMIFWELSIFPKDTIKTLDERSWLCGAKKRQEPFFEGPSCLNSWAASSLNWEQSSWNVNSSWKESKHVVCLSLSSFKSWMSRWLRWTPDLVLQDQPQPFLSCCVLPEHSDDFPCVLEANQKKTVTTSKPCLFNFPSGLFRFALLLAGSSGPSNAAGSKPILKGRNHFWYRSDTALMTFQKLQRFHLQSSQIDLQ